MRSVRPLILVSALTLTLARDSVAQSSRARVGGIRQVATKTVDPCTIASADQLKFLIASGIARYFPLSYDKDGDHVRVSNPQMQNAECPRLRITVDSDVRYDKTRGFPQFQTSGALRFASPASAVVTYSVSTGPAITADALRSARACLTSVEVTTLDLENIPSWLDNTWVKEWLNTLVPNVVCFDVTSLVYVYLKSGHTL